MPATKTVELSLLLQNRSCRDTQKQEESHHERYLCPKRTHQVPRCKGRSGGISEGQPLLSVSYLKFVDIMGEKYSQQGYYGDLVVDNMYEERKEEREERERGIAVALKIKGEKVKNSSQSG